MGDGKFLEPTNLEALQFAPREVKGPSMFEYRHDKSERKVDTAMMIHLRKGEGSSECSIFGRAHDKPPFLLAHMHTVGLMIFYHKRCIE